MKLLKNIKNKFKEMSKGKKILLTIGLLVVICLGLLSWGTDHDVNRDFVNGTDTGSFTYAIGYVYDNHSVTDNFTITVDTVGNWTVSEVNGNLLIQNKDNNTINDVSITKDDLEYSINGINTTEEDVDNSVGIFEVIYSSSGSALVKLYQ